MDSLNLEIRLRNKKNQTCNHSDGRWARKNNDNWQSAARINFYIVIFIFTANTILKSLLCDISELVVPHKHLLWYLENKFCRPSHLCTNLWFIFSFGLWNVRKWQKSVTSAGAIVFFVLFFECRYLQIFASWLFCYLGMTKLVFS